MFILFWVMEYLLTTFPLEIAQAGIGISRKLAAFRWKCCLPLLTIPIDVYGMFGCRRLL